VRPYEVMIIFASDLEDSEIESLLERSLDLLRANDAVPGTVERWGRRTFAYEVKHRREGYYVLVEFSAEPKAIAELDRFLLLLDEVVRHKIIRLPDKAVRRASTGVRGRAKSAPAG
jgi:small subunit ribosomal protein S6